MNRRIQFESSGTVHRGDPRFVGTLAIVGRPNVGKSTLFNRLVGSRRAIVGNEPGITRDRLYGEVDWSGHRLRVVDTGGIVPNDRQLIPSEVFRQARVALEEANAIVLMVDGRTELASPDIDLARLLRRTGKPLLLAVNKVDTPQLEPYAEQFRSLGIRHLFPISAENGNGIAELLEHAISVMAPEAASAKAGPPPVDESENREEQVETVRETRVAIIGRPNVGKSTLLNTLTGSSRAIVSPLAGTTRDAVDETVEHNGRSYRFIDTAGIRRKGKTELMAEKLSVIMARKHLEGADVALLLIDATVGVTAGDASIAGYAHESGRSVIVLINKWDLVTDKQTYGKPSAARSGYMEQVRQHLKFLSYAPVLFVSATKNENADKIFSMLELVARERSKRISTGQTNRFLAKVDFERASVPMAKRVRILYMTQTSISPPTFILFTDRAVKLHFSYQRFLENQIRAAFGFVGTPIRIKTRARSGPHGRK